MRSWKTLIGAIFGLATLLAIPGAVEAQEPDALEPTGQETAGQSDGVATNASQGAWSGVGQWDFIPIHASVLSDGRVLTYGGTRDGWQGGFDLDVWDPDRGLGSDAHTSIGNNLGTNLFCSMSIDDPTSDDTILVGGETTNGRRPSFVSRFNGSSLNSFPEMRNPRWYPTVTTLWDGRLLAQGGIPGAFSDRFNPVRVAEIYAPGQGWRNLEGTRNAGVWATENYGWWYPKSHVTPAGKIWNLAWNEMFYLNPDGNGSVTRLGQFPTDNMGGTSASVMYNTGLVLQVGGGERGSNETRWDGSNKASIVDLNYDPPRIRSAADMAYRRHWADAIVLPDGKVLAIGGSRVNNKLEGVAFQPELWDPETDRWTTLAGNSTARLYHSTTLLLPDGSVWTGGGGAPGPVTNFNGEVFYPPYLYQSNGSRADQPRITQAPDSIGYDQRFTVQVDRAIDRVTLIKAGNNTHGMSTQIFQELTFTQWGGQLQIDSPDYATVATPGRYFLFALDGDGVPSKARIVSLSGTGRTPPPPTQGPENLLTNGSFEQPDLNNNEFRYTSVPGWSTSEPNGQLELWDAGHSGVGAAEGQQLTELNVDGPETISQSFNVTPGASYRWSINHRGRSDDDTVEVLMNGTVQARVTSSPGRWSVYSGTYTAPPGSGSATFALRAIDGGRVGNLVDDLVVTPIDTEPPPPPPPPPGPTAINGRVTDEGGSPVAGVTVDLFSQGRGSWIESTTTGADGTYQFTVNADTCYAVTFVAPDGRRLVDQDATGDGGYLNRAVCLGGSPVDGVDATLNDQDGGGGPAGSGVVTDGSGRAVANVQVDLFQAQGDGSRGAWLSSTATGPQGGYRLELPAAGCYVHTLIAPEGDTFVSSGSRWLNRFYCAAAGETVTGLDGVIDRTGGGASLGGTITNTDGTPTGAVIDLFRAQADGSRGAWLGETVPEADGTYRFGVEPGCYVAVVIAPDGRVIDQTNTRYLQLPSCVEPGETIADLDAQIR